MKEHPFNIAGHRTFRVKPKKSVRLSREEELAQIAQAKVTYCPEFTPKSSGMAEDSDFDIGNGEAAE